MMSSCFRRYDFKLTLSQREFCEKNARDSRGVQRRSLDSGVAEDSMNIESLLISRSVIEGSLWNPAATRQSHVIKECFRSCASPFPRIWLLAQYRSRTSGLAPVCLR